MDKEKTINQAFLTDKDIEYIELFSKHYPVPEWYDPEKPFITCLLDIGAEST